MFFKFYRVLLFNFGIPIKKQAEITAALQGIRAAQDVLPRFGIASSDGDLAGPHELNEFFGMVGVRVFKGFRAESFFSA